jgi:mono/diheme cytochrome c family protein
LKYGWLTFPLFLCWASACSAAAAPADQELANRGAYLARAADCMSCHTSDEKRPYAGGLALKSAYGDIYSSNITSDPQNGIGTWTLADFDRALRQGVRKDGTLLYPAMPYTSYTKLSDEDVRALFEFVRTIPPQSGAIPKNTLPFPLSVRAGMEGWQAAFFKSGRLAQDSAKSADWNRGAYLVEALGHCGECHTPRNVGQASEDKRTLTGATVDGWYAPNISTSKLAAISKWDQASLAHFLKTGTRPNNTKVFGPMQEVVQTSLHYLSDADLNAMALYLKDQKPVEQAPRSPSKLPDLAAGRQAYEDNCASCHQSSGKGIAGTVPALAGNSAVMAAEPNNVIMAMLEGFAPEGQWAGMASFAQSLSDEQISAVANYVRVSWGNNAVPNSTPWAVESWRKHAGAVAGNEQALLCPDLKQDVMKPALQFSAAQFQEAAHAQGPMKNLVGRYRGARPQSSNAEVVEALSTAYCRSLAEQHLSNARMSGLISDFAQRVAEVPQPHTRR